MGSVVWCAVQECTEMQPQKWSSAQVSGPTVGNKREPGGSSCCGNIRFKRIQGAGRCCRGRGRGRGRRRGLEVDEAAREGPGSGFSTVIRWVSSVPSRFQGGYCHESGVECMFPAARQSAFERLRAQVRRIVLFVRGALWLQVAVHVGPGQTHGAVASVTRPQQQARFLTRRNVLVARHAVDKGQQHTLGHPG